MPRCAAVDWGCGNRRGGPSDAGDNPTRCDALGVALDGGSGRPRALDHPPHLEGFLPATARSDSFKLSTDPLFVEKVREIVGLYLTLPGTASSAAHRSGCSPTVWINGAGSGTGRPGDRFSAFNDLAHS